jgi:hemolysin activation/secretion protein
MAATSCFSELTEEVYALMLGCDARHTRDFTERKQMLKKHGAPIFILLVAQGLWAQTLPSAGSQLQQLPTVPAMPGSLAPTVLPQGGTPAPKSETSAVFEVKRLQITGATVYTEETLLGVAGFEPGRALSLQVLQTMAQRITRHYQRGGYPVARAYLPAQEIRDGLVTLAVLEGRYGQVKLDNTSALHSQVPLELLAGLNPGDVIAMAPLEERLLLMSDLPGVQVRSSLVPGTHWGQSDLEVQLAPGARISGSFDMDNAGNRYTGENRIGATLNLNNPTGRADQASLRLLTSGTGLRYERVAYQMPVGRARVGVAFSDLAYRLGHEFEALGAEGDARIASVFGSYPLLRSRQSNMNLGLSLEAKTFEDRLEALPARTHKRAQVAVASWYGDHRDAWGAGGVNTYALAWSAGAIDIRTPAALAEDAATARSDGHYNKLAFAVSRVQRVSESVTLSAALSGQWASRNLDVSEKMELGGMAGVRAYPEGEAYADEGYLLTLEVRKQWSLPSQVPGQLHGVAFVDAGTVKLHHKPWAAGDQRRHLSGAGVGAYWTHSRDFSLKAFYARKLGHEDALSAPDKSGRLWVQGVKYF